MLAIRAGHAFDGTAVLDGGATVLLDGDAIAGVLPYRSALPDGVPVLDLPDGTVLPGLIDTHVHLCGDGRPEALTRLPEHTEDELDVVVESALRAHLAAGVTTVRDLGDRRFAVLDWRDGRRGTGASGVWPTVLASGPPLTSPGGHCAAMGGEVSGEDALVAAVRERAERAADVVKIMASGGLMTPGTDPFGTQFTLHELRLVVDEAHALGLPVTAHAHSLAAVRAAIAAGVDGLEHGTCLTPEGVQVPVAELASCPAALCPTLGADPAVPVPGNVRALMRLVRMTQEDRGAAAAQVLAAGGWIVHGTDGGINEAKHHGLAAGALIQLAAGGAPAPAVLATATSSAARALRLPAKGALRAGADADVLLVHGDATTDVTALRQVRAVVAGGQLVP